MLKLQRKEVKNHHVSLFQSVLSHCSEPAACKALGLWKCPSPVPCVPKQVPWSGSIMSSEKQQELAGIPAVGFGSRSVQMLSSTFLTAAGLLAVRLLSCCLGWLEVKIPCCAFLKGMLQPFLSHLTPKHWYFL